MITDHRLWPYFFEWATAAKIAPGGLTQENESEWILWWGCFLTGNTAG